MVPAADTQPFRLDVGTTPAVLRTACHPCCWSPQQQTHQQHSHPSWGGEGKLQRCCPSSTSSSSYISYPVNALHVCR